METYSSGLQVTAFHGNLLKSQRLVLQVRGLMHPLFRFCSQRTYSHPASLTLTWALSSKWWSALEQPPCSVLPVATLTQKSPGTKTSCPLTPVQVMGESNSYAQVRKARALPFSSLITWALLFPRTFFATWLFLWFAANVAAVSFFPKLLDNVRTLC